VTSKAEELGVSFEVHLEYGDLTPLSRQKHRPMENSSLQTIDNSDTRLVRFILLDTQFYGEMDSKYCAVSTFASWTFTTK
jgi:hypothetical protein